MTYVAVALVASFATGAAGIGVVAVALALGFATAFLGEQITEPSVLGLNALFIVCFGALSYVFTRAEIVRVRRKSELELAAQKEKVEKDKKRNQKQRRRTAEERDEYLANAMMKVDETMAIIRKLASNAMPKQEAKEAKATMKSVAEILHKREKKEQGEKLQNG